MLAIYVHIGRRAEVWGHEQGGGWQVDGVREEEPGEGRGGRKPKGWLVTKQLTCVSYGRTVQFSAHNSI